MQLILNFHNACRTKDENMIQIAVCPGKPKDLHSFFKPMFDEVEQMYKNKLVIKKQGTEFTAVVLPFWVLQVICRASRSLWGLLAILVHMVVEFVKLLVMDLWVSPE